ncbi:group III truncated hemoglobin [Aureispira anguillae]|uniref:Group III truncated hemoglobin n=1 Tax=Aureispira anguillae TaxID=2864201 RepID=A0A915YGN0_9BACT|nr:group III truncated hemoglobin [Aureispira anguillae]BDS12690.1 group III truncated hemoglobin [Aureispira anguillae]
MNEITSKTEVKLFVDAFYEKVRQDALLGPIFAAQIPDEVWPSHLTRMYGFWNTVLFGQKDYRGNPFSKHANLAIHPPHFERWLSLFVATIDESFTGEKAAETKMRAAKMAALFQSKLDYVRSKKNPSFHIL